MDDDRIRRRGRDLGEELGGNRRMGDCFEFLARLVVHECLGRERRPIERPVGREDVGAEPLDELGERGHPRFHDPAGDDIGVDDDRAPRGQHRARRSICPIRSRR